MTANENICHALESFDTNNLKSYIYLKRLDEFSDTLQSTQSARQDIGSADPSIWPSLQTLWKKLTTIEFYSADDNGFLEKSILCTARFTRNLIAGVHSNQRNAFTVEPEIRKLIHRHTALSTIQDPTSHAVTRMLIQTLSNLVTSNEYLIEQLWTIYTRLPEEQNILIRILAHPDSRTLTSTLVFILNCIHQHRNRTIALISTKIGGRICVSLLDQMAALLDLDETSEGGKAFEIAYHIFAQVFDQELGASLFKMLSIEGETITPHQTTFLKVLDSYLLQSPSQAAGRLDTVSFITPKFFELSDHAQASINRALGSKRGSAAPQSDERAPLQELDLLLPKVCEATVLLAQCLCTITLAEEEGPYHPRGHANGPKRFLIEAESQRGQGIIESLIELIRLLDEFLPRITFGKAAPLPGQAEPASADPTAFNYLKRDLVRFLGILAYNEKAVQDRVRACEGITVVMNLCVVDERNPYLREHALFTLRNILQDNPDNQAVVDDVKPIADWDENGVLREIPRARPRT